MDLPGIITHKIPLERGKQKVNQRDAYTYTHLVAFNHKDITITLPGSWRCYWGHTTCDAKNIFIRRLKIPTGILICPQNEMRCFSLNRLSPSARSDT